MKNIVFFSSYIFYWKKNSLCIWQSPTENSQSSGILLKISSVTWWIPRRCGLRLIFVWNQAEPIWILLFDEAMIWYAVEITHLTRLWIIFSAKRRYDKIYFKPKITIRSTPLDIVCVYYLRRLSAIRCMDLTTSFKIV